CSLRRGQNDKGLTWLAGVSGDKWVPAALPQRPLNPLGGRRPLGQPRLHSFPPKLQAGLLVSAFPVSRLVGRPAKRRMPGRVPDGAAIAAGAYRAIECRAFRRGEGSDI